MWKIQLFFLILIFQFQVNFGSAQNKIFEKMDFYYISWILRGFGANLEIDEIINDPNSSKYAILDTLLINSILDEFEIENLEESNKQHSIDVRMVIDVFYKNGKIETYSVGTPILVKEGTIPPDSIKPPLI
jgi:hypothetical protein